MMELSVQPDETALDLLRRSNRKPLRTGLAFLDEVFQEFFVNPLVIAVPTFCTAVVFGLEPRTVMLPCKTGLMLARLVLVKVKLARSELLCYVK